MDRVLVGIIVAAAAVVMIRRFLKKLKPAENGGCPGGCGSCAAAENKSGLLTPGPGCGQRSAE